MNIKLLHKFDQPWPAEEVRSRLEAAGIGAQLKAAAKEYTTVLGLPGAQWVDLFVAEEDVAEAQKILNNFLGPHLQTVKSEPVPETTFRKVVMLSFLGIIMVPILFSWLATRHLRILKKQGNVSSAKKIWAQLSVIISWICSLYYVYALIFKLWWGIPNL